MCHPEVNICLDFNPSFSDPIIGRIRRITEYSGARPERGGEGRVIRGCRNLQRPRGDVMRVLTDGTKRAAGVRNPRQGCERLSCPRSVLTGVCGGEGVVQRRQPRGRRGMQRGWTVVTEHAPVPRYLQQEAWYNMLPLCPSAVHSQSWPRFSGPSASSKQIAHVHVVPRRTHLAIPPLLTRVFGKMLN